MGRFEITKTPIVTEDIIKKVERREAGAITTFIGQFGSGQTEKKQSGWNMRLMNRWLCRCWPKSGLK